MTVRAARIVWGAAGVVVAALVATKAVSPWPALVRPTPVANALVEAGADWLPVTSPSVHAATLAADRDAGLAAAWFGGTREGARDVKVYSALAPAAGRALRGRGIASRFALGALWGLTPCVLVYGVLPLALQSGGAWQGALIMLAFGVGTLPNLLAAGWALSRMKRRLEAKAVRWAAGAIVAVFALAGLWRALFVPASLGAGPFCLI